MWNPEKKEDGGFRNDDRAEAGAAGVLAVMASHSEVNRGVEEDSIGDSVADILHLCDREGLDAEGILGTAQMHWQAER